MMKPLKLSKPFYLLLFLLSVFQGYSQNINSKNTLPESVIGEWYSDSGTGEYNGLLIHSGFIEFGYRAFMYQEIIKTNDASYSFSAKDILGNNLNCELNVLSKDSIQLKRGDMPLMTYVSRIEPKNSKRIVFSEVPQIIKKKWYTTDGKSNFEFDVTNEQFAFRDKVYKIDEIVNFKSNGKDEYRFIVKNNKEYWMFYFKNWSKDYLQVGFHGKMGDLYKSHKNYPNIRIDNFSDYAASVNGKRYLSYEKSASKIPAEASKWIDDELAKVTTKPIKNFNSPKFFNNANAKLIGYLKGYDASLGFTTGIIYMGNHITREDFPIVVQIKPDGRFEANLPLSAPMYSTQFVIKGKLIPFYIEPGQTLAITVDLFELMQMDITSLLKNKFKNIEFKGPLATENRKLLGFNFRLPDYNALRNKLKTVAPKEFKKEQLGVLKENLAAIEDYKTNATVFKNKNTLDGEIQGQATYISPKVYSVLKNKIIMQNAYTLLNYASDRKYEARSDTTNTILKLPIPTDYYDFLKDMPLDDKSLLVSGEFGGFINRFEFSEPLLIYPKSNSLTPAKSKLEYLEEEGVELSEAEKTLHAKRSWNSIDEVRKFYKENQENFKIFNEKYKKELKAYSDKYLKPLKASQKKPEDNLMEKWRLRDSVLTNVLGLEKSLTYDIVKIRALKSDIERFSSENANAYWKQLQQDISHPFLIEEGNRMVEKIFPKTKKTAYTLPEGKATNVFKNIIDPFKGKIVFVDFWATSCGPCVGGIKRMKETRKKYEGNEDFEFVFITDERSSPIVRYNEFVKEQELKNIYRLPLDDYNYLRELFKFNGIPRYVVIDREGRVLNDNFPMYNFQYELDGVLKSSPK